MAQTAAPDGFRQSTSRWIEKIGAGQTVRVVNPFGSVFSRFGGYENEVEVLCTLQRIESEKPELQVLVSPAADGLNVTVGPGEFETRDRVDLVVFVPLGATLDARTRAGAIEAEKLRGNVVLNSVKGDIRVRAIQGRVSARTARGRINATLENDVTEEAQEFVTETGDIEIHLWEDANMAVRLATSGLIGTDFSIEIEHKRLEEPNKHASAIVGNGGPRLTLASKEGQISLRRLQRGFRTDSPAPIGHVEDQDPD